MLAEIFNLCKFCLFDGAYLFYGLLVFAVSMLAAHPANSRPVLVAAEPRRLPPMPGGELPFGSNPPKTSIVVDLFALAVNLASFPFFLRIANFGIQVIRGLFLMTDNPTPLRSFWRYVNVYYLVILLPAAFMPPVSHAQRTPDFHLLAAVVLLICINAIGDVISVRLTLNMFKKFASHRYDEPNTDNPWKGIAQEVRYYLAVIRAGAMCLLVLVFVLMCSSILYGVQIGQMDFGLTADFFRNAWDRVLRFPELAWTLYWFRDRPGPFGSAGIPGLFIYGLTTFVPIMILSCLATVWLLLIPFRIAVNLPSATSGVVRVISAESAVFAMCLITSFAFGRFLFT